MTILRKAGMQQTPWIAFIFACLPQPKLKDSASFLPPCLVRYCCVQPVDASSCSKRDACPVLAPACGLELAARKTLGIQQSR